MIDSHPQISMFGELFWSCGRNVDDEDESKESGGFSLRPFSTFSYLDKETRELPKDAEAVGFKLMYGQLLRRPELLIKMAAQRYKLIHLVRRNAVDVIISRTLAEETGRYHSEGNVDVPRIEISPREFLGLLRKRERYLSIARNLMRCMPNKVISVFYEDVRENPKKEMHRITSFIYPECRRDGFEFSSTLKKVNRRSADEVLNNYNDIQKFMQNTEFVDLFS